MLIRLLIIVCILLSACALSNAQKKDQQDLFNRVIEELGAGRTEKAYVALGELIKQYPNNPDGYFFRGSGFQILFVS